MRRISIVEKKIIINHISRGYEPIARAIEEAVQNEGLSLDDKNELYEKCFEQLIVKRTEYEEMVGRIREKYSGYENYVKDKYYSLFIPWDVEEMWKAALISKELFMKMDQIFEGKIIIAVQSGDESRIQICDGKIEKIYYQGPENERLEFLEFVKEYAKANGFKLEVNNEIWG